MNLESNRISNEKLNFEHSLQFMNITNTNNNSEIEYFMIYLMSCIHAQSNKMVVVNLKIYINYYKWEM